MTLTLETLGEARAKAARRQRVGVINRYLGWFILPLVIAAVAVHYSPGGLHGTKHDWVIGLQLVFVPLVFVHLGLSLYVFGLVRPARTLRVFHIYFGYAYIFLVLASQTTHGENPQHVILTVTMFACLAVHVGIGIFYAMRRREARVERTPLAH
jgi:hypothetical protein